MLNLLEDGRYLIHVSLIYDQESVEIDSKGSYCWTALNSILSLVLYRIWPWVSPVKTRQAKLLATDQAFHDIAHSSEWRRASGDDRCVGGLSSDARE